jgi:hypothetical protein
LKERSPIRDHRVANRNLTLRRAVATAVAFLLLPLVVAAGAPEIWLCPLDPLFRPEVKYGGSTQYMRLFTPDAAWQKAAARTQVFKIYPQWIARASDADLRTQFADLERRGIALALEFGILTASEKCGEAVEGFGGQTLMVAAQRIKRNGGTLRYLAMDEPVFFSTLYTGKNACGWSVDEMADNAAANIRVLLEQDPGVQVGLIEPLPASAANWLSQYQAGIRAFQRALGFPLAFFIADLNWEIKNHMDALASFRGMVLAEGVRFGVIYNGNASDRSDARWVKSAAKHMRAVERKFGSPDLVVFQSWHAYPEKLLPEKDSDSFTSLVDRYVRLKGR